MDIKTKISRLEQKKQEFINNQQVAEKSGDKRRAHHYGNLIEDVDQKIKNLEKDIPIEANERLREIIDALKDDNESLRGQIEELHDKMNEQEQRIENFINPPEEEEEEEEEEIDWKECPWCHRKFKGIQGLKAHQRWCKQGGRQ